MKENKFDKQLHDELQSFESNVDVSDIWSTLDHKLDDINDSKKKKRRLPFFWWWTGLAVAGLIAISFYLTKDNISKSDTFLSENSSANNTVKKDIENKSLNATFESKKEIDFAKNKNTITRENQDLKSTSKTIKPQSNQGNIIASTANTKQATSNNQINSKNTKNFIENKTATKNITDKTTITAKNEPTSSSIKTNTSNNKNTVTPNLTTIQIQEAANQPVTDTSIPSKIKTTQNLANEDQNNSSNPNHNQLNNNTLNPDTTPNNFPTDKKPNDLNQPQQAVIKTETNPANDQENNDETPILKPKKWQALFSIHSGVSFINRTFKSSSIGSEPLIEQRSSSEKPLEAIHFSALAGVQHKSGFSIQSGLEVSQINERFLSIQNYSDTIVDENGIFAYTINPYLDTIAIYDRVENIKNFSHTRKEFNQYRLYNLPILLGYQKQKNNWSLGIQAGVIFNLRLKTKGITLNESGQFEDLNMNQYKSKLGLAYELSINGNYHLTKSFHLSLSPRLQYFPNSFLENNDKLEQSYRLFGLHFGLHYKIP